MRTELEHISKKHPFIVPQNYFEELEDRLLSKINHKLDSKSIVNLDAPSESYFDEFENKVLSAIKAKQFESRKLKHPFKTPLNYFEDFDTTIINKVDEQKSKKITSTPKITVWRRYSLVAIAASVALITGVFVTKQMTKSQVIECNTTACLMEKVSTEEIRTELDYIELTDDELTDLLSEKALDELITSVHISKPEGAATPELGKTNKDNVTISDESVIPIDDEELETDFFDDI